MAASRMLSICLVMFLMLILTLSQAQQHPRLDRIYKSLSDKGFEDMAEMLASMHVDLFPDLENLESVNKTYTVFAPGTPSFWARSNDDPSLSLIRYHIVPFKVERDLLESPLMYEHKLDTLLSGHPLVITTGSPEAWSSLPSLNLVPVGWWNIYNDGHLIVHGLGEFFNPEYQTDRYPWFNEIDQAPSPSLTTVARPTEISSGYFHQTPHGVFTFFFMIVNFLFL